MSSRDGDRSDSIFAAVTAPVATMEDLNKLNRVMIDKHLSMMSAIDQISNQMKAMRLRTREISDVHEVMKKHLSTVMSNHIIVMEKMNAQAAKLEELENRVFAYDRKNGIDHNGIEARISKLEETMKK